MIRLQRGYSYLDIWAVPLILLYVSVEVFMCAFVSHLLSFGYEFILISNILLRSLKSFNQKKLRIHLTSSIILKECRGDIIDDNCFLIKFVGSFIQYTHSFVLLLQLSLTAFLIFSEINIVPLIIP